MSRLAALILVLVGGVAVADPGERAEAPAKTQETSEPAKASKFPFKVVKILSDSEQALLFDQKRGRHVLVEVGDAVGKDYTVKSIDENEVTLAGIDVPVEIALAAPELPRPKAKPPAKPADPYADDAVDGDSAPADPYGDDEPIREASANTDPAVASVPDAAADATPDPKPEAKPADPTPVKLAKKDVTSALDDFSALAASIDGSFTARGLAISKVKPQSVFAKAGLATGDVIVAVDGKPMRSLDDAADLYARAGSMKSATVQILRAGKPQTLRIAIQ
jgi:hypothetical protein